MSRKRTFLYLFLIAGTSIIQAQGLDFSGSFRTDTRLATDDPYRFTWHDYRLQTVGKASLDENTTFHAEAWLRYREFSEPRTIGALNDIERIDPFEISMREAWVALYRFPVRLFDVTLGRRHVAWGRADLYSPTNVFDIPDLTDIRDFEERLAPDGATVTAYLGPFSLEGVYVPLFKPALLPPEELLSALVRTEDSGVELAPSGMDVVVTDTYVQVVMPDRTLENSMAGVRLAGLLFGYDFSLSYAYARGTVPIPLITKADLDLSTFPAMPIPASVAIELRYPRFHMIGADLAGALGPIGVRAETAVYFPEEIGGRIAISPSDLSSVLFAPPTVTALEDSPFFKAVAGVDYTFPNGIYANLQYLHGFLHEYGDNLNDYLILDANWEIFNNQLRMSPLNAAITVSNWEEPKDSYAILYQPKIEYLPRDNVSLALGLHWVESGVNNPFTTLKSENELFVRGTFTF